MKETSMELVGRPRLNRLVLVDEEVQRDGTSDQTGRSGNRSKGRVSPASIVLFWRLKAKHALWYTTLSLTIAHLHSVSLAFTLTAYTTEPTLSLSLYYIYNTNSRLLLGVSRPPPSPWLIDQAEGRAIFIPSR
jgi:hypothetical protein